MYTKVDETMVNKIKRLHESGYTVIEIADECGVSRPTIYRHLNAGKTVKAEKPEEKPKKNRNRSKTVKAERFVMPPYEKKEPVVMDNKDALAYLEMEIATLRALKDDMVLTKSGYDLIVNTLGRMNILLCDIRREIAELTRVVKDLLC